MDKLTVNDQQRLWAFMDEFETSTKKIDRMYDIIVGDEEMKQEGMITKHIKLEGRVDQIQKKLNSAKSFIAGAFFVGGASGSIITLLIRQIFKL